VPLIEKAYAKLFGCYQALISGFIDDGLADMTGYVCEKKTLHEKCPNDKVGIFSEEKEKFWQYLKQRKRDGCLMGCSVTGGTEHSVIIDGVNTGVISGHAYGLLDVFEITDKRMENPRKTHRLLRIRNPWGQGEWKGKWSDESEQIEENRAELEKYINELQDEEKFELNEEDGTFLINYASFRDIFNRLFVANNFPDSWWAIRFNYEWNA